MEEEEELSSRRTLRWAVTTKQGRKLLDEIFTGPTIVGMLVWIESSFHWAFIVWTSLVWIGLRIMNAVETILEKR